MHIIVKYLLLMLYLKNSLSLISYPDCDSVRMHYKVYHLALFGPNKACLLVRQFSPSYNLELKNVAFDKFLRDSE